MSRAATACAHRDGASSFSARSIWVRSNPSHSRFRFSRRRMHASLLLWNDTLAHAYPNYQSLWRIEPDVMFSGNMSSLLALSARVPSDLLLPAYVRREWDRRMGRLRLHTRTRGKAAKNSPYNSKYSSKNLTYYHWDTHEELLEDYPPQVSVLVCAGVHGRGDTGGGESRSRRMGPRMAQGCV